MQTSRFITNPSLISRIIALGSSMGCLYVGKLLFFPVEGIPVEEDKRDMYKELLPSAPSVLPAISFGYTHAKNILAIQPAPLHAKDYAPALISLKKELLDIRSALKKDFNSVSVDAIHLEYLLPRSQRSSALLLSDSVKGDNEIDLNYAISNGELDEQLINESSTNGKFPQFAIKIPFLNKNKESFLHQFVPIDNTLDDAIVDELHNIAAINPLNSAQSMQKTDSSAQLPLQLSAPLLSPFLNQQQQQPTAQENEKSSEIPPTLSSLSFETNQFDLQFNPQTNTYRFSNPHNKKQKEKNSF